MRKLGRQSILGVMMIIALLAMLVGTIGAAAAAPAQRQSLVVQVQSLDGNPVSVNLSVQSVAGRTRGIVTLYDPQSRLEIVGTISVLVPIDYGYHFEGCGVSIGMHRGMICFVGAAQAHPYGNQDDFFSFVVTRGYPYQVYGQVTSGGGVYYQ
jgi:hypothetical protein